MSGSIGQSFLRRVRQRLWRRGNEHSLRESIAELMQEAEDATEEPGTQPERVAHGRHDGG